MRKYFLSVESTACINETILEEPCVVLSRGLLESALHQPYNGYYDTVYAQAAALFRSLLMNHCFKDGNKRTACALLTMFLQEHKLDLSLDDKAIEKFILSIIASPKESHMAFIESWLANNTMDHI